MIVLSVIVPVKNEAENIGPLIAEIHAALDGLLDYEIIYVDDGSSDETYARLRRLQQTGDERLRVVRHAKSCGQSTAVLSGVKAARGVWIATLDGDGQNDPADIPALWRAAQTAGAGQGLLLAGHRARRRDSFVKRATSRIANRFRAWLLQDSTPDTGCGLKLFERGTFLQLPYFDHMHRFLPALVLRAGGKVVSVKVNHRPRAQGKSNYGTFDRLWVGITDIIGVVWLQRRAKRPVLIETSEGSVGTNPQ